MVGTREKSPHVPLSTEEILADVATCSALGASIVHVHARDENGAPTHRKEHFAPIVEGIRRIDPELVVCVTCSGRFVRDVDERAEVLELSGAARPDMASLTLGSNNFARQASVNSPQVIVELAERMTSRGIAPELEVFEPGMLHFGRHLADRGVIPERCYVNVLLGNPGTSPGSPAVLAAFLSLMPERWLWSLGGIGRHQLDANLLGVAAGGGVRVGLEDNLWADRARTRPATNREAVERVVRLAELAERPIASAAEVRARLGLPAPPVVRSGAARRAVAAQRSGTG